jgi:hypothetical protein
MTVLYPNILIIVLSVNDLCTSIKKTEIGRIDEQTLANCIMGIEIHIKYKDTKGLNEEWGKGYYNTNQVNNGVTII